MRFPIACLGAALLFGCIVSAYADDGRGLTFLTAPDLTEVAIMRDDYGVPHISASSTIGIFYGQGFAVAQDRLVQMEINRRAALGRLAELYGSGYVALDQQTRSRYYTAQERSAQLAALPAGIQEMLAAYAGGINLYLDSMAVYPEIYRPLELASIEVEPWSATDAIAVSQFFIRRFGQFGGQELARLAELQAYGSTWFDQNRPINDPLAPTTIPAGVLTDKRIWEWAGQTVRSEIIAEVAAREAHCEARLRGIGLPPKFGSFAVQITPAKSATGNVMLLGCPQMGSPLLGEANAINEVELICPAFHVGGMTVPGIPAVIIGHTENFAWTLTSGITDNTDVYIETTQDASLTHYLHNSAWIPFEAIPDTVYDSGGTPHPFTIYRTIHGPVFGTDLSSHQAYTYKMSFWNAEMDLMLAMYGFITAYSHADFALAVAQFPVSFNVFCVGHDQRVTYWHAGLYQDRSDGVDPRLPHNGDGSEEWGGIIPFAQLPQAEDPPQGHFVNWNNKPVSWWDNGDNVPWVGAYHPVLAIESYVAPISAVTFVDLKGTPQAIGSHGTYQQAVEFASGEIIDENIVPPGQSAFFDLAGNPSPHIADQWPLHVAWQFKDMLFTANLMSITPPLAPATRLTLRLRRLSATSASTQIDFGLALDAHVRLEIYDVSGALVRTLVDEQRPAGPHRVTWNGRNGVDQSLPTGIYFCRLATADQELSRKLVLF